MNEFVPFVKPGDPIRASWGNQVASVSNRMAGAKFGSNTSGVNSGTVFSSASLAAFHQALVEVKEPLRFESGETIDGHWNVRLRWFNHEDDEWATDDKDWDLDTTGSDISLKTGDILVAYWNPQRGTWIPTAPPPHTFRVKNISGDTLPAFSIVGLEEPIHLPGESDGGDVDADFKADAGDMTATVAEYPKHIEKWAITLAEAEEDAIVPAVDSGVCICKIDSEAFPNTGLANIFELAPDTPSTEKLKRLPYGRAEIIWKDPTSDWAIVNLGIIRTPLFPVKTQEDLHSGQPVNCKLMLLDGSDVDDTSDEVEVYDTMKVFGEPPQGSKGWAFFNAQGYRYEFIVLNDSKGDMFLVLTKSSLTWHEGSKRPPSITVEEITWDESTQEYMTNGTEHTAYWSQAPRDDDGNYVIAGRMGPGLIFWIKWVAKEEDASEGSEYSGWYDIVDGTHWSGLVKLYEAWDYSYTTPQTQAKIWYYGASGNYGTSGGIVTVRNPLTPRDDDGNFIKIPIGYSGEIYSVICGTDGQYTVTGPRDVTTICALRGQWSYPSSKDGPLYADIQIYGYNGTSYVPVDNGDVTGYYFGAPRNWETGQYLHVPLGTRAGGSAVDYEFGICRWYAARNRWEIISMFNPQQLWKGRLLGAWSKLDGASVDVEILDHDGNPMAVSVTVKARGHGFPDGTVLNAGTDVVLFYLPDDGELWFLSAGERIQILRGKLDEAWEYSPNATAHVTFESPPDPSETGADAKGWGFDTTAQLPSGHEVVCFKLLDVWWFIADSSGSPAHRGVTQEGPWIAGETGEISVAFQDSEDTVEADGWGYPEGTEVAVSSEVWVFQAGDKYWFISDTPGPRILHRGALVDAWESGNDAEVRFVDDPDREHVQAKGWGFPAASHLAQYAEVTLFQAGADGTTWYFLADTAGTKLYRGKLNGPWSNTMPSVNVHREVENDNVDAKGWGFESGVQLDTGQEVALFEDSQGWWFVADTKGSPIYRGETKEIWVPGGVDIGVRLLDPPGHIDVTARGWGYKLNSNVTLEVGDEIWVRQIGTMWFFWSDQNSKQLWRGKINTPTGWSKPPNNQVEIAVNDEGKTYSAFGYGYPDNVSLPFGTEVWLFKTRAGYFFCSATAPEGSKFYRGKIKSPGGWTYNTPVSVELIDTVPVETKTASGWGFQSDATLPFDSEVWVFQVGSAYWFVASGANANIPRRARIRQVWKHDEGNLVDVDFEENIDGLKGTGWGYETGAVVAADSEVWALKWSDEMCYFWSDTGGKLYRAKTQAVWSTGNTVQIKLIPSNELHTAEGWGYLDHAVLSAQTEVWAFDAGDNNWYFFSNRWPAWRGEMQEAWKYEDGDTLKKVGLKDIGGQPVDAAGWGYKSGDSLEVGAQVWLMHTTAGWRFWSAGSGGGGLALFLTTGPATDGFQTVPPSVDAQRQRQVIGANGAIYENDPQFPEPETLYWPGAPRAREMGTDFYLECGLLGPGMLVWAQEIPCSPVGNQWQIIGDPIDTWTVKLTGHWNYGYGEAIDQPVWAKAKIWYWNETAVGRGEWKLGGETAIRHSMLPKALDGTHVGLPYGEIGELYTVKRDNTHNFTVIAPRDVISVFRVAEDESWTLPTTEPLDATWVRAEILRLEGNVYRRIGKGKYVTLISHAAARKEDDKWAGIPPGTMGLARWISSSTEVWEVLTVFSGLYVFKLYEPWTYEANKVPTGLAKLYYLQHDGTYSNSSGASTVTVYLPDAPKTPGGLYAKVPVGGTYTWGVCMWSSVGWRWEVVSLFNPQQIFRATIKGAGNVIEFADAPGVGTFQASRWCGAGDLEVNSPCFVMYDTDKATFYILEPPASQQATVVTDIRVSGTKLEKKTREIVPVSATSETDWTEFHEGVNCPNP